ncbi:MAG: long-chain fatty acid--CoA ligase [Desulfobacteraceae bacterium]|nr:MAG: long-chain fatty acid--CoA ligase [Desulfobacteraceae bacterium]
MHIDRLIKNMELISKQEAIIFQDKIYYYKDILNQIEVWEQRLKLHNIEKGKVVSIISDYSPEAISVIIALIRNQNIIVPLSPSTEVQSSDFHNISYTQHIIELLGDHRYQIEKKDSTPANNLILRNLIENKHAGLILFTSGSSGKPKAVVHDFEKLLIKFQHSKKNYRTLCFMLFDHIAGIDSYFYCLFSGGMAIYPVSRNPAAICKLIEKHKVEVLPTSPTFLNLLLISEEYKKYDLSSLEIITFGSERMHSLLLDKIKNVFPGVKLIQKYGVTELGSPPSKTKPEDSTWIKIDSDQFQTRIIDDILYIKTETAMLGYLNAPSPFTADGWYNTGDTVIVDGEYLQIIGRKSEIINVGGEKVYPAEVEEIIQSLSNVDEVVVYGEKNVIMGQIVCAKVTLLEEEDSSQFSKRLKKYCKDKLEPYKIPVKIKITKNKLHNTRFKKIRQPIH